MIRAVVDTNIFISGLFWGGVPSQVYQAAIESQYRLITSEILLHEFRAVLERAKFANPLIAIGKTAELIVTEYRVLSEVVEPAEVPLEVIRDPKDRALLACAVAGKADFLVSGDNDLLVLSSYEGISILNARQLMERLTPLSQP